MTEDLNHLKSDAPDNAEKPDDEAVTNDKAMKAKARTLQTVS